MAKCSTGIYKHCTAVGVERRCFCSDHVIIIYILPDEVACWQSLLTATLVGLARTHHSFVDQDVYRDVAIGTDKFFIVYFEGHFFDVTPLATTISSATFTFNGSTTITITTSAAHNLEDGDIVLFDSVTLPGGTGLSASDFEDKLFQVVTTPTSHTFTITFTRSGSAASGGSVDIKPYE